MWICTICNLPFCRSPDYNWLMYLIIKIPWRVLAQSDARPSGDNEVVGSILAGAWKSLSWRLIIKYFLRSFIPFTDSRRAGVCLLRENVYKYWLTTKRTKHAHEKCGNVNWPARQSLNTVLTEQLNSKPTMACIALFQRIINKTIFLIFFPEKRAYQALLMNTQNILCFLSYGKIRHIPNLLVENCLISTYGLERYILLRSVSVIQMNNVPNTDRSFTVDDSNSLFSP